MAGLEPAQDAEDLRKAVEDVRTRTAEIHASVDPQRLPMWTVLGPGTSDHPGMHVARLWFTLPEAAPTEVVVRAATLEQLRSLLPPGLDRIPRQEGDDRNILETWL